MTVIVHTTDLTGDDEPAFLHAAALALAAGARLVTLHGNPGAVAPEDLPDVKRLVARWGRPIEQRRICHECCDDVAETILDALRGLAPDLVVTGTHARHGLASILHGSVAEAVARNLTMPTLVVPNHGKGFVDAATGKIDLRCVRVAAADGPRAGIAARKLIELAGTGAIAVDGPIGDACVIVSTGTHPGRDERVPVLTAP